MNRIPGTVRVAMVACALVLAAMAQSAAAAADACMLHTLAGPQVQVSTGSDPQSEKPQQEETAREDAPSYTLLEDRLTMREPFNLAQERIRIVAFLSPSCGRCLKNAGELVRDVFRKRETDELAAFLVWLNVRSEDNEEAVDAAVRRIQEPRIQHFWDPKRILNHQLRDAIMFDVNVRLYDIFLLYGRDAVWEKRVPRPGYWMHEYKGAPGPWWNVATFAKEVDRGLNGEPFSIPYE
ncbi:MAG: hypothetical protein JSW67_00140 [Candidatus Latescibacterota bacterium]|nr:MAG: hypothetical protein JSW67_00140 [Candidatus Latescibacterota bacterium]